MPDHAGNRWSDRRLGNNEPRPRHPDRERSVEEARTFYADTIQAVMGGGEPENPGCLEGLFEKS